MSTDNDKCDALTDRIDTLEELVNEQALMLHALANALGVEFVDTPGVAELIPLPTKPVDPMQPPG